uniref:Uncharacterized protein n=1 Tax=viral metagenome TaxID=1070528 RepID=A0A6H1ZPK7_9ZZZZ
MPRLKPAYSTLEQLIKRLETKIAKLKANKEYLYSEMGNRGARIERYHTMMVAWRNQLPEEFVEQMDVEIDGWIKSESIKPKAKKTANKQGTKIPTKVEIVNRRASESAEYGNNT